MTGVVTLTEVSTETSLVLSSAPLDTNMEYIPLEQTDLAANETFDLPLDADTRELEVSIISTTLKIEQIDTESKSEESDHTYDDTMILREVGVANSQGSEVSGESDHLYDDTITLMQPVVRSQEFVTSSSGALNDSQALLNNSAFDIGDKNDKINFVEEDEMAG